MTSSNPVCFFEEQTPPSWGFFDETWTMYMYGFETETDARIGLAEYLKHLETGKPYCLNYSAPLAWSN